MIAAFYDNVPGSIRLLLAVVLFVGISLLMLKLFHAQMLMLSSRDGESLPEGYTEKGKAYAKQQAKFEARIAAEKAAEEAEAAAKEAEAAARAEQEAATLSPAADGAPSVDGADEKKHDEKKHDEKKHEKKYPPEPSYLAGRVLQMTGLGFVFLMAFTLSNFWGNSQAALTAIQNETTNYNRAHAVAELLPAGQGREEILAGLEAYGDAVLTKEWPALHQADSALAMQLHDAAGMQLVRAMQAGVAKGADKTQGFDQISNSVDDLISSAVDRINQLPGRSAPTIVLVVFVLAITNLALTMIFQPTRIGVNMFLVAMMAGVTAFLLFFISESANPFNGSNALAPPFFG